MRIQGGDAGYANLVGGDVGDLLTVALSDDVVQGAGSDVVWTLLVDVELGGQGRFRLGEIATTSIGSAGEPVSRVVAIGFCPGATGWHVTAVQTGGATKQSADLVLASSKGSGGTPGVTKLVHTAK